MFVEFTVPVAGTYFFAMLLLSHNTQFLHFVIYKICAQTIRFMGIMLREQDVLTHTRLMGKNKLYVRITPMLISLF